uniref:Family with sequence similarity 171 member B n=1 Tax=Mastacembelus armatus TaxID=205130 RepID=A0A3Q3S4G2_9TELE
MRLLICLISALSLRKEGNATGELTATAGRSVHIDDRNFSKRDHVRPEPFQYRQVLDPLPGSAYNLKVQVNDVLSRQYLSQAVVEVYINYTRTNTALTREDGGVLLHVPYQTGLPVMVVASKNGYICSLLPFKTMRMPVFSSVTMSLLGLNRGNIWLFEDTILITGKTSDASSHPVVQFSKSLLNLTDGSNVTSVKAYLTIPNLSSENQNFFNTLGIISSKSGYVSVELSPVAAVSVQLFSGDIELLVSGPIKISLRITDSRGLQTSSVVPAWFFNQTTGGWMRKGLGKVESVDGKLRWTFTAPHLGYWIAAPLSSTRGKSSINDSKRKKILAMMRKDQTTSTCDEEIHEVSSGDTSHPQDGLNQSVIEKRDNQHKASVNSVHNDNVIANPNAVAITLECNEPELNTDLNDQTSTLTENLFFYNQPIAILHAPAFFHLEEQTEPPQRSKSATLPRVGASNSGASEPLNKDNITQTMTKGPSLTQNQAAETEDHLGVLEPIQAAAPSSTSRGHFSLPESVSVPGTLNKVRDSRHSVHTLGELSKMPSPQPPRAWFVSLEGKPAAEIHYAVSDEQRRRRPVESRETSLDSGVDMSELNQLTGRRAVTLERNATFVKSTSSSKHAPPH